MTDCIRRKSVRGAKDALRPPLSGLGRPPAPQWVLNPRATSFWRECSRPRGAWAPSVSTPKRERCDLAAAYQVDDFEAIAGGYRRGFPLRMRDDLQISLHGQPICRQTQVGDELFHVQPLRDFTRPAIHLYC